MRKTPSELITGPRYTSPRKPTMVDGRARPRTTYKRAFLSHLITDRPQTRNICRREVPLALALVVLDVLHRVAADLFSVLDPKYADKEQGT